MIRSEIFERASIGDRIDAYLLLGWNFPLGLPYIEAGTALSLKMKRYEESSKQLSEVLTSF